MHFAFAVPSSDSACFTCARDRTQGVKYPNASTYEYNSSASVFDCGLRGCLFRLDEDPSEEHDVAAQHPDRAAQMAKAIREFNSTAFSPHRGSPQLAAACSAAERYGGFWGPFIEVKNSQRKEEL